MRRGAAILFAVALVQLVAGLLGPLLSLLQETRGMAANHGYDGGGLGTIMQTQLILSALGSSMFAFFGALVIDRLDRWLVSGEAPR
jgi:hypothetical protein